MFYFVVSLLIILPILTHILSIIYNKKIFIHYLIAIFLCPIVLISNLLIPFFQIDFLSFQILIYVIFCSIIISLLSLTIYKFIKNKSHKFNFISGILSPIIISVSLLLFVIFNLLISVDFGADIIYSINISSNFKNSIFSSENVAGVPIPSAYSTTPYLFVFPALFPENIIQCYSLLIPLLNVMFMVSISYYISIKYIKEYKTLYNSLLCLCILVAYFIFAEQFQLPWILTMGSLLLILFELKKFKPINIFIYVIAFSFFSSTSYLLFLPIVAGIIVYLLICKKWRESVVFIPILFYLISYNAFVAYFAYQIFYIVLIAIFYFLSILALVFIYVYQIKLNKLDWDYSNYGNKFFTKKNNKYIIPTFFLIFIASILLFYFLDSFKPNALNIVVYSIAGMFTIYLYYNATLTDNQYQMKIISTIFIVMLICLLEYSTFKIMYSDDDYHLISRIILIFNGLVNNDYLLGSNDIYFILTTTFLVKLTDEKGWFNIKNLKIFNKIKFDIKPSLKTNWSKNKKYYIGFSSFLLAAYIPLSSLLNLNSMFNYKLTDTWNYQILNNDEISFLSKLNFRSYELTYMADFPVGPYINQGIDLTPLYNYDINDLSWLRTQLWQNNGFYIGLGTWNVFYPNNPVDLTNINETVSHIMLKTINLINELKIPIYNIKNGKQYNSVDFVFLYKNISYFPYYYSVQQVLEKEKYQTIMNSENILCLQKI